MTIDRITFAVAGALVLASIVLSQYSDPRWVYLAGFVGAMMFQGAFTGFCPLPFLLKKMGVRSGCCFQ
jgi:Protein of unknown function (DUF2892)